MENPPTFVFYTYSVVGLPLEERWKQTGISDIFFDDCEEARNAIISLREDVTADPEMEWSTTVLEKIKTVPMEQASLRALLNQGPGAIVASYEIIESFGPS